MSKFDFHRKSLTKRNRVDLVESIPILKRLKLNHDVEVNGKRQRCVDTLCDIRDTKHFKSEKQIEMRLNYDTGEMVPVEDFIEPLEEFSYIS
jgi:hypothetical protein